MAGDDLIGRYLTELGDGLGMRVGRRDRVLAEAEEHLRSMVSDLTASGMTALEAQHVAIERFGRPDNLAARFVALDHARFRVRVVTAVLGVVWGVGAALIALTSLGAVNGDARLLVGAASVVFPLAAVMAAFAAVRDRLRLAGALLVVSAATPTYFFWVANLPALIIGVLLISGAIPRRSGALPVAKKLVIGVGAAAVIASVMIGMAMLAVTVNGGSSGRVASTKNSFCSVMTETNGSRLIELVRSGQLGDSTNWIVDGSTNMALPPIRHDMMLVRDGVESQPANPTAETHAAAARVDAFVLKTCGPQQHH
jgi:HAAS